MLRLSSADRGDMVTDCALELLAEGGSPAVTLRSLADRIGASSPGVLSWFGTTDRMWQVIAGRYGQRWIELQQSPFRAQPLRPPGASARVHGLLPGTDDEVVWTRVWLALVEVGRHRDSVGAVIGHIEADELHVARRLLGSDIHEEPDGVLALVRGLRHAICAPTRPMPVRRAHELLAQCVRPSGG